MDAVHGRRGSDLRAGIRPERSRQYTESNPTRRSLVRRTKLEFRAGTPAPSPADPFRRWLALPANATHHPNRTKLESLAIVNHRTTSLLVALLLLGSMSWAQDEEASPDPDQLFLDTVHVQLVNFDVFVTDKKGNPITDLQPADFEVFEDGRPVAITHFRAVVDAIPRDPVSEASSPRPEPSGTPPPARAAPTRDPNYIVIVVDNLNIRPFNRKRVFGQIRDFLRHQVQPEDKVLLATMNRNFKVREPFTTDRTRINSTLIKIEKETTGGPGRDGERTDVFQAMKRAESISSAMGRARMYSLEYRNDTRATISALRDLVVSLGGLEGRKALLYVSDGLPMVAGEDVFMAAGENFDDTSAIRGAKEFDMARNFQNVGIEANTHRVTFYTIDATGLRAPTAIAAEHGRQGPSPAVEERNQHNLQAPLRQLADITGGRAILNQNDVGPALTQASQDLYTYYSLGYRPVHPGDGRYHGIEVKVRRKGVDVRHRQGYRDRSAAQRMIDGTKSALLYGEANNRIGAKLTALPTQSGEDGRFLVPVEVHIPIGRVTLVPSGGRHLGRLRVFVGVLDDKGRQSPIEGTPLLLEIPDEDLPTATQQSWIHQVQLMMRPGSQRITVGILDELAGLQSYASGVIKVPSGS